MPLDESQIIRCTTVDQFLNALDMAKWTAEGNWSCNWVFRGESDGSRPLVPTAWRPATTEFETLYNKYDEQISINDIDPVSHSHRLFNMASAPDDMISNKENVRKLYVQIEFERNLLGTFRYNLNQMGMPVLGSEEFDRFDFAYPGFANGMKIVPLMALAQHHAIPTRLLDWSVNPYKALFFGLKHKGIKNKDICVWAWKHRNQIEHTKDYAIERIDVERSMIGFLHAQEGCFSYNNQSLLNFLTKGKWPDMADVVHNDNLKQITIPGDQKRELLRRLYLMGISFHTMMPSYDSIAKTIKSMVPEDKIALAASINAGKI